ncbi:FtsW/RodA/SpoVE family cell cycle protein [Lachnoclostridium sp. Marseille-P6806]|uniref:FtsW/RodA/SpoVE family cell cycle protein n=1 Tax=Lachnoclostridium sp. Marseille-P6806 TaxID=2364793 RepID=UPI001F5F9C59|nr:FtsW/RodA/SpoVE family cell cycle protein [Lachnoclostridium sp. Marseille-P6806]
MERDLKGLRFESRNGIREVVSRRGRLHLFDGFSLRHFDFILLLLVLALNIIGIYAIGSAEPTLRLRQIYGTILSLAVMTAISALDYHRVMKCRWLWYLVCLALLAAVNLFGSTANEAQRWISIGGLRFQPSESAKILLILFYASFITRLQDKMKTFSAVLALILLVLPPIALVYLQPDLSTSIMIFIIICVMMFVGGLSWKLVTGALIISVPAGIVVFNLILQEGQTLVNEYQRGRVLAWLHPEQYKDTLAYQTMNSMMAIGSGQLLGKGYNTNEISSLLNSGYISESQTDFIFTVIGEETGFIGTTAVVLLLVLVSVRCMFIALQAKDVSGSLIAAGVGAWIGFQGIINIGVATGVLPNTGLPLPFVSYGLTSLLCLYAGIGFILNVRMQSKKR